MTARPDGNLQTPRPAMPAAADRPTADSAAPRLRHLGDYELLDEIARGGMGVIYRARQITLNRVVALKMIRDGALASAKTVQRFRLEAEAVAKLHHPNIVPIHEFGEVDGHWFLSMSLIEGRDLARERCGVPLEARVLAPLMLKLARAVHYAHQRGVLHRDLKPANVLLDAAGDPHVTDFGLAKLIDATGCVEQSLEIVGSPNYMAPEQAVGGSEQVTTAADVYSLGAIMYELLSGRPPFKSESPLETLRKVMEEEPTSPRQLYRFADADLETICLKCMEKHPRQRYDSAAALGDDLERWLEDRPIQARRASTLERVRKWSRRNPKVAVLAVLLHVVGALALAGILWSSARATASARESHERLVRMHVATGNRFVEENDGFQGLLWLTEALRLEPGEAVRQENHRYRIDAVLRRSARLEQLLFHGDWIIGLAYSPEGTRVLTGSSDRTARIWNVKTGESLVPPLAHTAQVQVGQFSPDGRRVLTMGGDGIARVWDAARGAAVTPPLLPDDLGRNPIDPSARKLSGAASFSPDGERVLTAWGSRSAHLWEAATGRHLLALPHGDVVHHAAFSRDGRQVVTSSSDKTARIWDARTGQMAASPLVHDRFVAWAQFSPEGRRVLTVSDRKDVHVWDWASGREVTPPVTHGEALFHASFSPDGRRLLTASWDMTARIWDAATGLGLARFYHPGGLESASFSPDGRWVATACYDGAARLWDPERGDRPAMVLPAGASVGAVAFSPDGRNLAVASWRGSLHLWDLRAGESLVQTVPQPDVIHAEFDADARRVIAASAWDGRQARVWDATTGAALGPALLHSNVVRRACFSRDGRHALTTSDDETAHLWEIATGRETLPPLRHPRAVHDAMFSVEEHLIITACEDGQVRLWDAASGKQTATLLHTPAVTALALSPDGSVLASGSSDGTARLWRLATGQPSSPALVTPAAVRQLRFSADGARVVTASESPGSGGGVAQVWDIHTGRPVGAALRHDDDVVTAEFGADGRAVVTASADRSARVWDARTGNPLTPPLWHRSSLVRAVFTPDAHRVATLTADGDLRLWDAVSGEAITPPIAHAHRYDAGHLMFSADGRRLLVATGADACFIHEFTKTDTPVNELLIRAQVLSGHRIDSTAGMVALGREALRNAWQTVHASGPAARAR